MIAMSEVYLNIDPGLEILNPQISAVPFAGWSTIDLSKRREAVKVREEDSHKPRMRDGQSDDKGDSQ